ncbi:uncharacterized protein LOC131053443 isoform X2 [Cryptomeria japonica]|nr:uncharacterized protein LOC131053443 isoform X2 [Cryptomeria japonica]XP_057844033.2 uncharacterized protein LOC131053443 isoform X2 [Cryptomeria japonica]
MQRQCKVHSIYVRSTAQVYELYRMTDRIGEIEYVCTVCGEIAMESCDSNHRGKSQIFQRNSINSAEEDGTKTLKVHNHCKVDGHNLAGILEKTRDESLENLVQQGIVDLPQHITKGKHHESDEDSWVQVKSSGSLEVDSSCERRGTSRLQTFNEKKYVKDTMNQKLEASDNKDCRRIQVQTFHEPASMEDIYFDIQSRKGNMGTVSTSGSFLTEEDWVVESVNSDNSRVPLSTKNIRPRRRVYEGTVEIVNAKPCLSVTIKFPSVQDKSSVEVREVRVQARPVGGVMDEIKLMDFSNCFGDSLGGSLLAMLVPSILESSRDGLSQGQDALFDSLFHGREENEFSECKHSEECESSECKHSEDCGSSECGSSQSESSPSSQSINKYAFIEKSSVLGGQHASYDRNTGEGYFPELLPYENVHSSGGYPNESGGSIGKFENITWGKVLNSDYDVEGIFGNDGHGGIHSVFSESGGLERVNEQMEHGYVDLEAESSAECSTGEVESITNTDTCTGGHEEYHGRELQYLVEHVGRLEALCARIEVNLFMALDKMEKRIQLLESRYVLPDQLNIAGMDHITSNAGKNSSPGGFSPISTSGIQKSQKKKDLSLDAPSPSSFSSSGPLAYHEFNKKSSSPLNTMGCMSHSSPAILSVRESAEIETSDAMLNKSTPAQLNQQDLSDREKTYLPNFSSKDSHGLQCESEVIATGAGNPHTSVCEHTITTKKNLLFIDEAIASELAAFSASTHEEETSKYTDVGNMVEENIHYHDFLNFYSSKESRFRTQEGMESVLYGSPSQHSLDLGSFLHRGYEFEDNNKCNFLNAKQAFKPDIYTERNFQNEIASLECKAEPRLLKCRTNTAEMKNDVRKSQPNMVTSEPNCQKQYQPLEHSISSKQTTKDCNLRRKKNSGEIPHKRTECAPCKSAPQNPKYGLLRIKTALCSPKKEVKKDDTFIGSEDAEAIHNDAMHLHDSSTSHVNATCKTNDADPARMSLEALLCGHNQQDGKSMDLRRCTETESSLNISAPKRPHVLFFIEDESLADFSIPNSPSSSCAVHLNNCSLSEGLMTEASPLFDNLLW